jgi:hypothetical protein
MNCKYPHDTDDRRRLGFAGKPLRRKGSEIALMKS